MAESGEIHPDVWVDLCGADAGRDCWSLVAEVYRRLGTKLVGVSLTESDNWRQVDRPEPAAVVLTQSERGPHVGICLGSERFLHSTDGRVAVAPCAALGRAGFPVRYFVHAGTRAIPVAPVASADSVRIVHLPRIVSDPTDREIVERPAGCSLRLAAPVGANVVVTAQGPRPLSEVEDRTLVAGETVVYATVPGIFGPVLNAILLGIALTFLSSLFTPSPKSKAANDDASPTFDLSGIRNTAYSGAVQPVVYGTHRVGGNIISAVQKVDSEGRAVLYLLLNLSRGPIQSIGGLTADADELTGPAIPTSIQINGQAARNYPCAVSVRLGSTGQAMIPGFSETATTYAQTAQLLQYVPFGYTTTGVVDGFDALVTYPSGLGEVDDDTGDAFAITMQFIVRWRIKGATTWTTDTWNHTSSKNAQISFQYSKRGLTRDVYEIQVERQTQAAPFPRQYSDSFMLGINEVTAQGFTYPGVALLGLRIIGSDQIGGQIPTVTSFVEGRKVYIWDGVSETSPSFGTGETFTANPAWCGLDLLINKDYGLGRNGRLTLNNIKLSDFSALATLADTSVNDGRGSTQVRAKCNHVADTARSGWETFNEIMNAAWARPYIAGNKVRLWLEKTASPSFLFTQGNARDVQISYIGKRDRPNAVEVSFANEEVNYDSDTALKFSDSAILTAGEPVSKQAIRGTGVTRAAQAYRLAQYGINKATYAIKQLSLVSGPESLHLLPGDVAYVHSALLGIGASGRTLGGGASTVKLDRAITVSTRVRLEVEAADDHRETVYIAAGTYAAGSSISIVDSSGAGTTWGTTPAAGSKWIIASLTANTAPLPFRIESVKTDRDLVRTFTGSLYSDSIYSDDPGTVETFTDELPNVRSIPSAASKVVAKSSEAFSNDGTVSDAIRVTFETVNAWDTAEVWYRATLGGRTDDTVNGSWRFAGWSRGELTIPCAIGSYEVCVRTRGPNGAYQSLTDAAKVGVYVRGRRTAPSAPSAITASIIIGTLTVRIVPPTDPTIFGYQIRYGSSWAASVLIAKVANDEWSGPCPFLGSETIRVRSITSNGTLSETELTASVKHVAAESIYLTDINSAEATGFTGTKSNTTVTASQLALSGSNLTGTYVTADKTSTVTKEVQELRITCDGTMANVAMLVEEACRLVGSTWATSTTLAGTGPYLDGFDLGEHTTVANAMYTLGGMPGSLYTVAGPPDIVSGITPTLEYDVNTGSGFAGSYTTFRNPISVENLTGTRVRATLNRPHSRYDPRLTALTTTTLVVGCSEPERMTTDFVVTSATAAGTSIRGAVNSTNTSAALTAPSGKKAVPLTISGVATAGATAGTYTVDFGFYNVTDGTWTTLVSGTGTAGATITASTTLTRASATLSFTGGKFFFVGYRNNASSPGALANTVHRVSGGYIYEDV